MAHEERSRSGSQAAVTEQELVQRVQAGDPEAFDALFRQHVAKVLRQAMHLLGNAAEAEAVVSARAVSRAVWAFPHLRKDYRSMAESVPASITCEQATALLIDYVTGELDPATTLVLERHLERCVDCVAFLRTYKETIRTTRTLRYDDLPGELQDRLLQTLHAKMRGARAQ